MSTTVGFLGTGNMGSAIAVGLSHRQDVPLCGFDLDTSKLEALAGTTGLKPQSSIAELIANSTYLVLAVKPQQLGRILSEHSSLLNKEICLISIVAGIPLARIKELTGNVCPVVRVMPNTPALIGSGVFALCFDDPDLGIEHKEFVQDMFMAQGQIHILEEKLFDAFTAVVGSGPAYVIYVMEALVDSAVTLGIQRQEALAMVTALFKGTVKLAEESDHSLSGLREMVSSPGGSTLAGLNHFDRKGVRGKIIDGILKAHERNVELGRK